VDGSLFSIAQTFGHSHVNTGWVVGTGTEGKLLIPGWTYKIETLFRRAAAPVLSITPPNLSCDHLLVRGCCGSCLLVNGKLLFLQFSYSCSDVLFAC
jgi:hypothetical protein